MDHQMHVFVELSGLEDAQYKKFHGIWLSHMDWPLANEAPSHIGEAQLSVPQIPE